MSDWTDSASDLEDLQKEVALEHQRKAGKELEAALNAASGFCLNCEEPLEKGRYCDESCREDHEKRVRFTGARRSNRS